MNHPLATTHTVEEVISVLVGLEEKLAGTLYQYLNLHDRSVDERLAFAKQMGDMAQLLKQFTEQIKGFKELESKVRRDILETICQAAAAATQKMTEKFSEATHQQIDASAKKLQQVVDAAATQLYVHKKRVDKWQYLLNGGFLGLAVMVGIVIGEWLFMPTPYLPLTGNQLQTYESGRLIESFWPKLSKKEQQHLLQLAKTKSRPQSSVADAADDGS